MDPITLAFAGAQAGMGIAKAFSGHSEQQSNPSNQPTTCTTVPQSTCST